MENTSSMATMMRFCKHGQNGPVIFAAAGRDRKFLLVRGAFPRSVLNSMITHRNYVVTR